MPRSHLTKHNQAPEELKGFQQELLLVDVASLIYQTMQKKGVARKELADSLGLTKGRITQYLGGERNLTLRTLADIFTSLESRVVLSAEALFPDEGEWHDLSDLTSSLPTGPLGWATKFPLIADSPEETHFCEAV